MPYKNYSEEERFHLRETDSYLICAEGLILHRGEFDDDADYVAGDEIADAMGNINCYDCTEMSHCTNCLGCHCCYASARLFSCEFCNHCSDLDTCVHCVTCFFSSKLWKSIKCLYCSGLSHAKRCRGGSHYDG